MGTNVLANIWKKARKFGLDYDDFPTIIENLATLLRSLTINILNIPKTRIDVIFYIMTIFGTFTYCYTYIFSMVWMVFIRYGKADITASSVALALTLCSCTSLTKIIFMTLYSKEIRNTVGNYLKCDSQVTPNTRFAKNLRKELKTVKRRAAIIWITLVSDAVMYVLLPILTPGRHFASETYLLYGLEPMVETPNYEIATLIMTVSVGFSAYAMVTVAIYVTVIAGYNEAQLLALSEELRNLWNDSEKYYNHITDRTSDRTQEENTKQKIINEFIKNRLNDIIKFHTSNINLIREFNKEFRPFFTIEYIIMILSIIIDLLDGLENTYLALPYTFVLISINCLSGQRLIDACVNFEKSLYDCQWESFNASNQRTVLLMLTMSQKTLVLSIGGVATLDFNCLMVILKSSYSAYTTLQSTMY